jgi:xanthine/CO dehydrogenase XdhC/CoxF family maturation factor
MALATRIRGEFAGEKFLLDHYLQPQAEFSDSKLNSAVLQELTEVFNHHRSETKTILGEEIFFELIQPVVSLIIFGGGFDARPVSTLAKSLGWDVQVTDECVSHIAPVFFPTADKLSLCQREFIDRDFAVTPYTACVLMSHNYEYDRDVLKKLIQTTTPYIGILGPRKRFDKMLSEFEAKGIVLTPEDFQRIHSPIGLDIGAETPDEIALSILAEIQGKFANRSGGFLKYRSGPIHERKGDQVFKQVYLNNDTPTKSVNG